MPFQGELEVVKRCMQHFLRGHFPQKRMVGDIGCRLVSERRGHVRIGSSTFTAGGRPALVRLAVKMQGGDCHHPVE